MRDAVRNAFVTFTTGFEGMVTFMYLDDLGLVTTGMGNLIDPEAYALNLPWIIPGRGPATTAEVRHAWEAVKARQDLRMRGGMAFRNLSVPRLAQANVDALVQGKLAANEHELIRFFPSFEAWCADAQLALLSMAWGMGADFAPKFPAFCKAVNAAPPDWLTAATECHESNGAIARNLANKRLFLAAQDVAELGLDPDVIHGLDPAPAAA